MNDGKQNKLKFPCIEKNGKLVTLSDCTICRLQKSCDIYVTMINEDTEEYED